MVHVVIGDVAFWWVSLKDGEEKNYELALMMFWISGSDVLFCSA